MQHCVPTRTLHLAVIGVSFTTPDVQVIENVTSGSTQVCFTPDKESARPYTVKVGRRAITATGEHVT
jgi:hypothetical protein